MLVNPVVVLVAAAAGFVACRALGADPHAGAMLLACGICLLAAESAMVPALLNRNTTTAALVQGTFLGTVLHLAVAGILGLAAILVLKPGAGFVYWLLALYWLTL